MTERGETRRDGSYRRMWRHKMEKDWLLNDGVKARDAPKQPPNSLETSRWSCSAGLLHAPQTADNVWYKPLSFMPGLLDQRPLIYLSMNMNMNNKKTWVQNLLKAANTSPYGRQQHSHEWSNPEYYNLLQQAVTEVWAISSKCQSNYGRVRLIICQVIQERAGPHCEMQQTPQCTTKYGFKRVLCWVRCFLHLERLFGKRNCNSVVVLEDINLH